MSHLRARIIAFTTAAAACLASSIAFGGEQSAGAVYVNAGNGSGSFSGSLAGARFSSDSTESIGCEVSGAGGYAYCYATDPAGHYLSCTTTNAAQIASLAGLNDTSFLWIFESQGNCVDLFVENASVYIH